MTAGFQTRKYWEDRLRDHCDLSGVGYLRLGRAYNTWLYRVRAGVFDRAVHRVAMDWPAASVLDVGCGTGFYIGRWETMGAGQITGIDLTQVAVDTLSRSFPHHAFHRLDIGEPLSSEGPLARVSFQAISAMDVLFHIVDDDQFAQALRNLADVLAPGGTLLWSDNFIRHGDERVAHQASRSLVKSERAVRDAGLEIVERVPMFVLMNYPADTRTRVPKWLWTALVSPAALAEPLGWLVGAGLYPLERWLVAHTSESPSTELMICRKPICPSGP